MFEFHTDRKQYHELLSRNAREFVIPFIERSRGVKPGDRVLEIGCGDGGNLAPFLERGCRAVGVELDPAVADIARATLQSYVDRGELQIISRDIYEVDTESELGGGFDVIVLKDVIEHIHDQPRLLRRMREMLTDDGVIFFGFPPWQMPFGGHQQICRGKWTSRMPWYHLLPRSWYRTILDRAGEDTHVLMEIRDTGISIERFERIVRQGGYVVRGRQFWLVNPVYQYKFGWKPRKQIGFIGGIPWVRNFFTTCAYYVIAKDRV